ncbi:HET domain-containing protein [Colletotrichum orchidophilum]|uniref:HET domain-containing protein n=1 Tax=Colletotrichum orchidophilum TaxID=1209926 RepID=A0A1G4BQK9_9PEZI|nr:HET domain-containing protein [Colletotrichum orchidophilum]OHF03700.1 HET domain-containing protein [Colletotrichum orchidophilum]
MLLPEFKCPSRISNGATSQRSSPTGSGPATGQFIYKLCTMRLINTSTLQLEDFFDSDLPKYAILSHTWGTDEVTFQEWLLWQEDDLGSRKRIHSKRGFQKISNTCRIARQEGISHVWVDTNCIDKKSSAELSEAINSMFAWYRGASICYVHLEDLEPGGGGGGGVSKANLRQCRWFTRGWTLQELLAPADMTFYDGTWEPIGTKETLAYPIASITGIDVDVLIYPQTLSSACVAKRMSWASSRQTTRTEDTAYCLLGIFQIHMPLLYGEGHEAFRRLQEEIMKVSTDQSLFAWDWTEKTMDPRRDLWVTLLAPHPSAFSGCGQVVKCKTGADDNWSLGKEFTMTNLGLSMTLPLIRTASSTTVYAAINCKHDVKNHDDTVICIPLWTTSFTSTFGRHRSRPQANLPIPLANVSVPVRYARHPGSASYFPRFSELPGFKMSRSFQKQVLPEYDSERGAPELLFQLFSCNDALESWQVGDDADADPQEYIQTAAHASKTFAGKEVHAFCVNLVNHNNNNNIIINGGGRNGGRARRWCLIIMWCEASRWKRVFFREDKGKNVSPDARKRFMDYLLETSWFSLPGDTATCDGLKVEVGLKHDPPRNGYCPVVPLYFDKDDG